MHNSKSKLFFLKADFDKIKATDAWPIEEKLRVLAEMVRYNTLTTVVHVRSGHLGASLSAIEVFTVLYHQVMSYDPKNPQKHDRDIFILSKGHAAPGQYSVLASAGFIPEEQLLTFRKFKGLQGHVDTSTPGIDGNTGSLGMGLSKGKGYAWAVRNRKVFVMVGDGELQEGQNWEAIQSAKTMALDNLYLIIDRNMVQTDREVAKISDMSPLKDKLESFGWNVTSIDGNNVGDVLAAITRLSTVRGKPKCIISNTLKGKGISFMEHPQALITGNGRYKWHGGIPNNDEYRVACSEILNRVSARIEQLNIELPTFSLPAPAPENPFKGKSLKSAFSKTLLEMAQKHSELVVLDADLAEDCGLAPFEDTFHQRFVQIGIAEQDMVSMAGSLAMTGLLPIVNTYTSFLTSRSNEQIFNAASEKTKVIYIGHLAGLLPSKPGKSHQGIRDISLLRSIPGLTLCAPCNGQELEKLLRILIENISGPGYLRLEHACSRNDVELPSKYEPEPGKGIVLCEGTDIAIITYGPLMVSECLLAAQELSKQQISVRVINLPWLNNLNPEWLIDSLANVSTVFCVENHIESGGQGEEIRKLVGKDKIIHTIGIKGFAQSGDNSDVLRHYGLDHLNLVKRIISEVKK